MSLAADGAAPAATAPEAGAAPAAVAASTAPVARSLEDRVAAKREAAERAAHAIAHEVPAPIEGLAAKPTAGLERGPDGKFLPRTPKAPGDADGLPAAAAKPEAKAADAKPADADIERYRVEAETRRAEAEALRARDTEWEGVAEQALARIDRLEAENKALRAGRTLDARDDEILRLREGEHTRKLAAERAEAHRQAEAQRAQAEANERTMGELRSTAARIIAEFPQLKPGPGAPSREFWQSVMDTHQLGGAAASLAFIKRAAPAFAAHIKPTPEPAALPQARTLGRLGGTGGGSTRDLSPEGIKNKYMGRLSA